MGWSGPSGTVIPVLPPTHFNFSYLGVGAQESVPLAAAIDVSDFSTGALVVRLHENKMTSGRAASVSVLVFATAPCADDPREFRRNEGDIGIQITDISVDVAPKYFEGLIGLVNGPCYSVELQVTQGVSASALAFQLSVDLVMRRELPDASA